MRRTLEFIESFLKCAKGNFQDVLEQSLQRVRSGRRIARFTANQIFSLREPSEAFPNDNGNHYPGCRLFFGRENRQTRTRTNQRRRTINNGLPHWKTRLVLPNSEATIAGNRCFAHLPGTFTR